MTFGLPRPTGLGKPNVIIKQGSRDTQSKELLNEVHGMNRRWYSFMGSEPPSKPVNMFACSL